MTKWFTLLLATIALYSQANTTSAQLALCTKIVQADARLKCFDALMSTKSASATQSEKQLSSVDQPIAPTGIAVPSTPSAPTKIKQAPVADTQLVKNPIAEFGAQQLAHNPVKKLEQIHLTVKTASKNHFGKWRITFENGQIWQQIENEYARFKTGDEIIIKRGTFNSFYLFRQNSNRKLSVKRIK